VPFPRALRSPEQARAVKLSASPVPGRTSGELCALLLCVALAFALRLAYLGDASIWWDEGLAVWAARLPLREMARWTAADVHPPLYFALLHFWRLVAGDGELAVRFLSAAFGVATVAAIWRLGRLLAPERPWVAAAAALLLALSRFAVWWSQEARMYALGGLLCVLNLIFAVRLGRRLGWRSLAGYLVVTAAALWTLYLLTLLLVVDGAYWVWLLRERPAWRARMRDLLARGALLGATLAAFAPWLAYSLSRTRTWSTQVPFDAGRFAELYAALLSLGVSTNVERVRVPALLLVGVVAAGALALAVRSRPSPRRGGLALLLLALAVPPAVVWLLTTAPRSFGYSPKPEARYLLPYAAAYYLLAAWAAAALAGLAGRARRPVAVALVAALALPQLWSLRDYYAERVPTDDYTSIAATLRAHVRPGDLVVLHTDDPWPVFAYHWPEPLKGTPHLQDADPPEVDYYLAPLWAASEAIWLVVDEDALRADPQLLFDDWLARRASASHTWRFGTKRVVLYARTPTRAEALLALAPGFVPRAPPEPLAADGLRLVGWEQPLRRILAGEVASAAAYVERREAGGMLSVRLGDSPQARADVPVPPGDGVVRLPIGVLVPPDAAGAQSWVARLGDDQATLGQVEVIARRSDVSPVGAGPRFAVGASFGAPPIVRLLGYDLGGSGSVGGTVAVTLYWEALEPAPVSYKVFTHLISPAGRVAAQRDDFPVGGERPTTSWRPGEVIVDRYDIALKPDVPPGVYPLRVGLYDPATGERLGPVRSADGVVQANDQLQLAEVEVRPAR